MKKKISSASNMDSSFLFLADIVYMDFPMNKTLAGNSFPADYTQWSNELLW